MQYALMTEPQVGGTYDELLGLATWAEGAGLVSIARSDHYLNGEESAAATDALATLAGLARETRTIKLTVLVSPITFRHPAVIAKTAATIDEMSGGRLELGIGTGWMESEHRVFGLELPEIRERFSRLYETLAYVSAAFGRTRGGHGGRHYDLEDIEVLPRPVGRLPIIVGGSGKQKTPMMAGRFADEYNSFAGDLDALVPRVDVMRRSADEAGRDPDEVLVSIAMPTFVGADDADYREVLSEAAADRGVTPDELAQRLTDRAIPHGPADRVATYVADAAEAGVGRVYLQEYKRLDAVDTERLDRVLAALDES